ncbi:MAG: NAD(P)-dependent oxidoreductase [Saprospiraceae bacterium]
MKIAILGSTGGTGLAFIEQALAAGHTVNALARRPEAITIQHPNLKIYKGDVFDVLSLERIIRDSDTVVSSVGIASIWKARKTNGLYSQGTANIIQAMKNVGKNRLIVVSSGAVEKQPNDPWFFTYLIKPLFLNPMYDDMRLMERALRESGLNYTIVRPPYLTDKALTGKYRLSRGKNFTDDKDLSRQDLAHFLLQEVEQNEFEKELVAISY